MDTTPPAADVIAWRRHLHANPELSFHEYETSQFVHETLESFGGLVLERPTPTSVVARLHGDNPGRTLALRADMDALPINEESGVEFASRTEGVMHACGHDGHTAALLAVARTLVDRRAELVDKLQAVCHRCGGPATMTQRLVDGHPAPADGATIVVGALDSYEARCRSCHVVSEPEQRRVGARPLLVAPSS